MKRFCDYRKTSLTIDEKRIIQPFYRNMTMKRQYCNTTEKVLESFCNTMIH